jgi:small subunit ribosomal protein S17
MQEEKKIIKRRLTGTIISTKMDKTAVVRVNRVKMHPKYKKRYVVSKHFQAHIENKAYRDGEVVVIEECRPISKRKRYRVIGRSQAVSAVS